MNFKNTLISSAICMVVTQPAFAAHHAECGDPASPLLSVSDFDGDGAVTGTDISLIGRKNAKGVYAALYDRNADGELNGDDVALAAQDMNASSTVQDQWLAQQYNRFEHFQGISGHETIAALGYIQFGGAIKGHGVHWNNESGFLSIGGFHPADQTIAEGLNVTADGTDIPALFWGEHALPLFNDPSSPTGFSPLDYPTPGGAWFFERVQALGDTPPDFIPGVDEPWHTHAGTCVTLWDEGAGPEWQTNQYMSAAECQALPNLAPIPDPVTGQPVNPWGNFWMLHVWLFDLNPNGVFANTHPCIDPDAQDEASTNGGREVPIWFQLHGGHS